MASLIKGDNKAVGVFLLAGAEQGARSFVSLHLTLLRRYKLKDSDLCKC